MSTVIKRVLDSTRLRRPPNTGFAWIDRRFVTGHFLANLAATEALVYYFLVSVADHQGLSFFGDRRIASELKLSEHQIQVARSALERKDLILFRSPLYQVLSLPRAPDSATLRSVTIRDPTPPNPPTHPADFPRSIASILSTL